MKQIKYGGTKSYMPYMSVLFVFTILFFDLQKILHLIFMQWNGTKDNTDEPDIDEDLSTMPMRKLRWLHNHRKVSFLFTVQIRRDKSETVFHHHQSASPRSNPCHTVSHFKNLKALCRLNLRCYFKSLRVYSWPESP